MPPRGPSHGQRLLLTFDAFGTLFVPREPIGKSYADAARRHGLQGFSNKDVDVSFREAYKAQMKEAPNYGKAVDMGATQWWTNVISSTFRPFNESKQLPSPLIPQLLTRFSSLEGYEWNCNALQMFQSLHDLKKGPNPRFDLTVGVITNSDDRVPGILTSLGLSVGSRRCGRQPVIQEPIEPNSEEDINFFALSYDVGYEKPDPEIFVAAAELAGVSPVRGDWCLHVGDHLKNDYYGAENAGWDGLFLGERLTDLWLPHITDLFQLVGYVCSETALASSNRKSY